MKTSRIKLFKYAAIKAIQKLESFGWSFDEDYDAATAFIEAFQDGERNLLAPAISHLIESEEWQLYSLKDIKNLDEARKIYRKQLQQQHLI